MNIGLYFIIQYNQIELHAVIYLNPLHTLNGLCFTKILQFSTLWFKHFTYTGVLQRSTGAQLERKRVFATFRQPSLIRFNCLPFGSCRY